ncbi:hypothetical protein BGZ96_001932 [Linnemannia gamsii]|uniref:Cytochrome P450 n=1 Tax=Linnemannia gamsii TaxID=64522 RepID=A0ABQ7JLP4_9FUNG|nr:hypothetical protein BGZ96_001932 [Linnemannia gamsii]
MALLHYLYLIYERTLTSTSVTSNKLKLITAIIALLTYKYRSHAIGTRRRDDLKEPKGAVPFLGHMFLMASILGTKLHDVFLKNYHELGLVWSISLPGIGRMVQGDSPELIEHVNKTNFAAYEKGGHFNVALGDIFGDGIICTDGEDWKSQRKQVTQVFNVKFFREYSSEALSKESLKVLDCLDKAAASGAVVDFQEFSRAFALDSLGSALFGESFGCIENVKEKVPFIEAIMELLEIASTRLVDPLWKVREAITTVELRPGTTRMIVKHRADDWSDPDKKRDLLMMFMEATDSDEQPYSDQYIVDMILNLMVAGLTTTSEGIAWTIYMLFREENDPEMLKAFVREVDEAFGDGLPAFETHKKLKFVEACFYETLRMFPALPRNLRLCLKDDILPDGTRIYAGERFTWSPYTMGRSERVWGSDVETFKPSRWLDGEKSSSLKKFNPFHLGPRECIGQGFAVLQATTILGFKNFEVQLIEPGRSPAYGVGMTLPMIGGLPVRVSRRIPVADVKE